MLPPRADDPSSEDLTVPHAAPLVSERWSVQLELADEEIAKLYGQGMTRGAVVWKRGMEEWRPLLVTQELTGLLRRTRTTLTTSTPLPSFAEQPAPLPRPPRVPSSIPPALAAIPVGPTTVSPMAMDVEPAPRKARRPVELAAVAVTAFAVAWIAHGSLRKSVPAPTAAAPLAAAALTTSAPACETRPVEAPRSATPSSSIPTVSVADLPLAGAKASAVVATVGRSSGASRSASSSSGAPSRGDLMNALGQVARSASSCGERGGPVRVVISFAPSGVARSIQVSGQALPATARSCIIGAASRARVPAFSGEPVTVSKTL
jgi:hypothetical protein